MKVKEMVKSVRHGKNVAKSGPPGPPRVRLVIGDADGSGAVAHDATSAEAVNSYGPRPDGLI